MNGRARRSEAGFSLMEAMLALALTAAVVLAIAMIAGQWMPNWRHGFAELQRADLLGLGVERIVADVSAAEFVTPNAATPQQLFLGNQNSVIFVRSAFGPGAQPRLEVVRIEEKKDERGLAIVRTRAPFTPLAPGGAINQYPFADPVVLIRAPFHVAFAYAGPDKVWNDTWRPTEQLPEAVRVTVRDAVSNVVLAVSTATQLKVGVNGVAAAAAQNPADAAQQPQPEQSAPAQAPGAGNQGGAEQGGAEQGGAGNPSKPWATP